MIHITTAKMGNEKFSVTAEDFSSVVGGAVAGLVVVGAED